MKKLSNNQIYKIFKPELSPKKMLELGVFGGSYFDGNIKEYPEAWFKKFKAVLSAVSMVFVFAKISAITLFFLINLPSFILDLKIDSFPINLNACLQNSIPAITPFCLAIILAVIFLLLNFTSLVVISPIGLRSSFKAFLTTELIYL